jgi:hypothetical protein
MARCDRREDQTVTESSLVSTAGISGNSTREQPPLDPLLGKEGKQGRFKIPMVADRHIHLAINPQFATYPFVDELMLQYTT